MQASNHPVQKFEMFAPSQSFDDFIPILGNDGKYFGLSKFIITIEPDC